MANKTQYWLVDATGTYAQADGVEGRDQLVVRGFTVADEPAPNSFVYARHEGIEAPGRLPFGSLDIWAAQGWVPSAPDPEPSPFNGPAPEAVTSVKPLTGTDKGAATTGKETK